MKTKQYIQPATQVSLIRLHTVICLSIAGEDSQENAMAPDRQFQGDKHGLKYLI